MLRRGASSHWRRRPLRPPLAAPPLPTGSEPPALPPLPLQLLHSLHQAPPTAASFNLKPQHAAAALRLLSTQAAAAAAVSEASGQGQQGPIAAYMRLVEGKQIERSVSDMCGVCTCMWMNKCPHRLMGGSSHMCTCIGRPTGRRIDPTMH